MTGLLSSFVWAAFAACPGAASEAKDQSYIVVVGISEYADPQIKPKPHAEDDAKALYDVLVDTKYLDVKPNRVKLFLSKPDIPRRNGRLPPRRFQRFPGTRSFASWVAAAWASSTRRGRWHSTASWR